VGRINSRSAGRQHRQLMPRVCTENLPAQGFGVMPQRVAHRQMLWVSEVTPDWPTHPEVLEDRDEGHAQQSTRRLQTLQAAALSRLLELLAAAAATTVRETSGPNHEHQEADTGPKPASMCECFSLQQKDLQKQRVDQARCS
jgi:hypothetical protein